MLLAGHDAQGFAEFVQQAFARAVLALVLASAHGGPAGASQNLLAHGVADHLVGVEQGVGLAVSHEDGVGLVLQHAQEALVGALQLQLHVLAFGDVLGEALDADQVALLVAQGAGGQGGPDDGAVAVVGLQLEPDGAAFRAQLLQHGLALLRVGVDLPGDVGDLRLHLLQGVIPEHLDVGRVGLQKAAFQGADEIALRGILQKLAELLFRVAQARVGDLQGLGHGVHGVGHFGQLARAPAADAEGQIPGPQAPGGLQNGPGRLQDGPGHKEGRKQAYACGRKQPQGVLAGAQVGGGQDTQDRDAHADIELPPRLCGEQAVGVDALHPVPSLPPNEGFALAHLVHDLAGNGNVFCMFFGTFWGAGMDVPLGVHHA